MANKKGRSSPAAATAISSDDSYVMNWLTWHLAQVSEDEEDAEIYPLSDKMLTRWACELEATLPEYCALDRAEVVASAICFFRWCHRKVRSFDRIKPFLRCFVATSKLSIYAMSTGNLDLRNIYYANFLVWFTKQGYHNGARLGSTVD